MNQALLSYLYSVQPVTEVRKLFCVNMYCLLQVL